MRHSCCNRDRSAYRIFAPVNGLTSRQINRQALRFAPECHSTIVPECHTCDPFVFGLAGRRTPSLTPSSFVTVRRHHRSPPSFFLPPPHSSNHNNHISPLRNNDRPHRPQPHLGPPRCREYPLLQCHSMLASGLVRLRGIPARPHCSATLSRVLEPPLTLPLLCLYSGLTQLVVCTSPLLVATTLSCLPRTAIDRSLISPTSSNSTSWHRLTHSLTQSTQQPMVRFYTAPVRGEGATASSGSFR